MNRSNAPLAIACVVLCAAAAAAPAAVRAAHCLAAVSFEREEGAPLAALLPPPGGIAGWETDGDPLLYYDESLWEYIDGSAESFLAFDFKRVIAQDYLSGDGRGLKIEIYEHGSPLMAYGIYAQMRSPDLAFLEIGNEAFADEYSINFWKGPYYVRVAVFETGGEIAAAMKSFALAVAERIEEPGSLPPEARAFPAGGLVPRDTRYLSQAVLGRAQYPPAFVATYRWGSESAKLYLSTLADSAEARRTFDWFAKETGGARTFVRDARRPYRRSVGRDQYLGPVTTFQFDRWFGALIGLEGPGGRGEELIRRTIENLGKI